VPGDIEHPCHVGELGHHGDRDEEDEHRADACDQVAQLGACHRGPGVRAAIS
jgi:hypothetical protein